MAFYKYDDKGEIIKPKRIQLDCQKAIEKGEKVLVEQNHKEKVDINNIVRSKAGRQELIAKTAQMQNFVYDDVTTNDFQEMMNQMIRARDTFDAVPSQIRKKFGNDPAAFMDFVHNKENKQQLIDWGLANPDPVEPPPVKVEIQNSETPPVSPTGAE